MNVSRQAQLEKAYERMAIHLAKKTDKPSIAWIIKKDDLELLIKELEGP